MKPSELDGSPDNGVRANRRVALRSERQPFGGMARKGTRIMRSRCLAAVLLVGISAWGCAPARWFRPPNGGGRDRAQRVITVTRLYAGDDGESHFQDIEIPLSDRGTIGQLSEQQAATGVIFRTTPPDYAYDWHTAPQRQYVILLNGSVEVEVGDGTTRRFGPGSILLAEDTTGHGHRSRAVGNQVNTSIFVTLGHEGPAAPR